MKFCAGLLCAFGQIVCFCVGCMENESPKYRLFGLLKSRRVALGAGCRRFKSSRPDHFFRVQEKFCAGLLCGFCFFSCFFPNCNVYIMYETLSDLSACQNVGKTQKRSSISWNFYRRINQENYRPIF